MAIPATQAQESSVITEELLKEDRLEQEDGVLVARLVKYTKSISPEETKARIERIFQSLVSKTKDCLAEMRADPAQKNLIGRTIHKITADTIEGLENLHTQLKRANLDTALAVARTVNNIFDDEDDDSDEANMINRFNTVMQNLGATYGYMEPGSESIPFSINYEDEGAFLPHPDYKIIVTKEPKAG
jgi:phosphopantothenoylcysteine synthetase/decarboxylase